MKDHSHAWNATNLALAVMEMDPICVSNVLMDMSYVMECAQVSCSIDFELIKKFLTFSFFRHRFNK
jgi:hypothetical protein